MDPQKIAQMLASGDKEQIKAAQKQLQALGYNVGPKGADGGLGKDTSAAIAQFKQDYEGQQAATRQTAEKESAAKLAEAEARAAEARAREAEQDPTNRLTKLGTELGPYVAGGTIGYGISRGLKHGFDEKDTATGQSMKRMAANRSIRPDIAESELGRVERNRLLRTGRQFLIPGGFFAASQATRDLVAPQFEDPATRDAINLIATGEQGAGITLAAKQLYDMSKRDSPIDPEDRGIIKTRAAEFRDPTPAKATAVPRQRALPANTPPQDITPGSKAYYAQEAKRLGLKGTTRMTKADLVNAVNAANEGNAGRRVRSKLPKTGVLLPLAAGVTAYNMADGPAEASTGESGEASTGNKLLAGGTAAGTVYGANKLIGMIPEAVRVAGGAGLSMVAPGAAVDMTDADPENLNMARNQMARTLPSFMRAGAVEDAYQMAQVPERGVASSGPRVSRLPAEDARPLVTGEADDFDLQLQELSDIFAQLEAGDQPQQMAPAPMPVAPYAPQNRLLAGR